MDWKWWTKVSGLILFAIAVSNFYLGNFHSEGAVLEFNSLPTSTQLDGLNNNNDISFTFYLYNKGDKPAYIDKIGSSSSDIFITYSPSSLVVPANKDISVLVTLTAPEEDLQGDFTLFVDYNDIKITSDSIPFSWGSTLK